MKFMVWLRYSPSQLGAGRPRRYGPGMKPVRGERGCAASVGAAPRSALGQLYELADRPDLPEEAKGEETGLYYRLRTGIVCRSRR